MTRARLLLVMVAALLAPAVTQAQVMGADLEGAWAAETYVLADGTVHRVRGRIFFTDRDWQVLFFVLDEDGEVRRGSGEGGTYELRDGGLVFTHLFHLSAGDELPGLPAAELHMAARDADGAPTEPTDLRIEENVLTLRFPSDNRMVFRRR